MGNSSSSRRSPLNTTPTGLYPVCAWDAKVVRRLILERKLAPFESPQDEPLPNSEECPICFLYYSGGLNRSRCCRKGACTECYLQVKRPNQSTTCPFCNHAQYIVSFTGPLSKEEVAQEAQEQQKVQELKTIMRNEEIERDKQRMLEKERLRKEQELSGIVVPPSTAQHAPPPVQPPPIAHSVPSNPQLPPPFGFDQHYGSTYPPPNSSQHNFSAGDNSMAEADLDDLMLMEAIRLSLLDVQPQNTTSATTVPNPPHLSESSDSEDNYSSDDNNTLRRPITKHMTTETTTSTSTPITTLETIPNTTVLQEQLYDQDDFQDPLQLSYEPQLSDSKFTGSYIHNPQNSQHPQISQHEPVQDLIDPQKHQELTNLQDPLQPQDSQHPQDSQDHKDPQEPEDPEHSQDPQGSPAPQDPSHSQHCQDPQDSHELQDSQHSNLQDSQFLADLDTPQPGTDTNTIQSTTTLNPLFTQDPHPHHLHTPTNNATNSVTLPADPNECPPSQDIPHPKESDEETNEEATHTNTEGSL